MQRIYNFFSPNPASENESLLPNLEEVVVIESTHQKRNSANAFLYDEIQSCIALLKKSKVNTNAALNYKHTLAQYSKAYFYLNLSISISLSGASFGIMYYAHTQIINFIQQELINIKNELYPFNDEREKYHPYSEETEKRCDLWGTSKDIYFFRKCGSWEENGVFKVLSLNKRWHPDSENGIGNFDGCWLEKTINHPTEGCQDELEQWCIKQIQFDACAYPDEGGRIGELYNEVTRLSHSLKWDPLSLISFPVVTTIAISVTLYSAWALKKASQAYQEELQQPHDLAYFLKKPNHINRIINLANRLNISLRDASIESLIDSLNDVSQLYVKIKRRLTFLSFSQDQGLPIEISENILEKADLMPKLTFARG